jgi:hypothetical protein
MDIRVVAAKDRRAKRQGDVVAPLSVQVFTGFTNRDFPEEFGGSWVYKRVYKGFTFQKSSKVQASSDFHLSERERLVVTVL